MWSLFPLLLAHPPALLHTWGKALQSCPAVSRGKKAEDWGKKAEDWGQKTKKRGGGGAERKTTHINLTPGNLSYQLFFTGF